MSVKQNLIDTRALIADPACWTQKTSARDARGKPIASTDPRAVCWCTAGAIHKVMGSSSFGSTEWGLLQNVADTLGVETPIHVNDDLGHATTLRMFDLAIEAAPE